MIGRFIQDQEVRPVKFNDQEHDASFFATGQDAYFFVQVLEWKSGLDQGCLVA